MAYHDRRVKLDLVIIACIWFAFGPAWCACAQTACSTRAHDTAVCCVLGVPESGGSGEDCDDCLRSHPLHRGEPAPSSDPLLQLPEIPPAMFLPAHAPSLIGPGVLPEPFLPAILRLVCRLNC